MHVYFTRIISCDMLFVHRLQVHVYFALVSSAQITIQTRPPAHSPKSCSSSSVLPSSMHHKDRTAHQSSLSPHRLIVFTGMSQRVVWVSIGLTFCKWSNVLKYSLIPLQCPRVFYADSPFWFLALLVLYRSTSCLFFRKLHLSLLHTTT